jgi:hypothetical protein
MLEKYQGILEMMEPEENGGAPVIKHCRTNERGRQLRRHYCLSVNGFGWKLVQARR